MAPRKPKVTDKDDTTGLTDLPPLTPAHMKVTELREALSARGLSPKGLKKELVERLEKALEDNTDNNANDKSTIQPNSKHSSLRNQITNDTSLDDEEEQSTPSKRSRIINSNTTNLEATVSGEGPTLSNTTPIVTETTPLAQLEVESEPPNLSSPPQLQSNEASFAHPPHQPEATKLTVVHINNLVRPFTVPSLRELVSQFGELNDFWLDSLKSQCLIQYKDYHAAQQCVDKLNGLRWPVETGRILHASLTLIDTMLAIRSSEEAPQTVKAAMAHRHSEEPLVLDRLFRKTISEPPLYYLPATPLEDF